MRPLDRQRQVALVDLGVGVVSRVVDPALAHGLLQHPNRRLHPSHAFPRRIEAQPSGHVLVTVPPSTDADLQAAAGEPVDGRELLDEHRRMPQVVVQDEGSDAKAGRLRGTLQQGQGGPPAQVVGPEQDADSCRLGTPSQLHDAVPRRAFRIEDQPEAKRAVLGSVVHSGCLRSWMANPGRASSTALRTASAS
jgi:hypothetical protein